MIGLDGRPVPNGCDHFPDRFLIWDWKACCDVHDIAYTVGGTDIDRLLVELNFYGCLVSAAPMLAPIVAGTTFLVGLAYFNLRRWR